MCSKVPKLSIKIDKVLLRGNESELSVNVNSECEKNIFYDAVNNNHDVASYSIVDESKKLSDADENIIQELHDILSDDANFFPCNESNNMTLSASVDKNVESNDYPDFELDCPPIIVSPTKVSFSGLQSEAKNKSNNKELLDYQLIDMECVNTFSTQIYTSNDIFPNHFIYEEVLDEVFFNASNDSMRNNLSMIRELRVNVTKLSDEEVLSYITPKIPENNKSNTYYSVPHKELRIVLKKMTIEEMKVHINANSNCNDKNHNIYSLKDLRVSLTRVTNINSFISIKGNDGTHNATQNTKHSDKQFISINTTINAYLDSDNDDITNSLKELFGDTIDNNSKKLTIDCPSLDQNIEDVLSPIKQNDYQQQELLNENEFQYVDCHVDSYEDSGETVKTITVQSKKNEVAYGKKRKIIEQDFDDDSFRTGKVFVYDRNLQGLDISRKAVKSNEIIPFIENTGSIILIQNETILKRSARIYTLTLYKILFAGKYVYNDNYKRTIENLGGKVVSDPEVATVLVAKKFKRTQEFLCSICRGIPIVSIDWIYDSVESHGFVEPKNYLLKDTSSEQNYGFNLKTSLEKAREKRIFEGYTFIITSGIKKISFNQLKCLIKAAGGIVFRYCPKIIKPHTIIVSCAADIKKVQNMIKRKLNCFERVVSVNFITECILKQAIC